MNLHSDIYDDIYGNLRKIIAIAYIAGWVLVTAIQIVLGIIQSSMGMMNSIEHYLLLYVLLPAGIDFVIIGITLSLVFIPKVPVKVKNYALVISLVLICAVLCACHGYYYVCFLLYIVPICACTIFLDYKMFGIVCGLSYVGILGSSLFVKFVENPVNEQKLYYLPVSVAVSYVILIVVTVICGFIIRIFKQREKNLEGLQNENAKLSKDIKADGLTGLQNHTSFYTVLTNKLMKGRHNHTTFGISMLDIDDFKTINDTYGHAVGDEVLRYVSDTVSRIIGKHGIVFRYGGDEFAIIFHTSNNDGNVNLLERIRFEIGSNDNLFSDETRVTLSIGYYGIRDAQMSEESVFYCADKALYEAKYHGKNQVFADC